MVASNVSRDWGPRIANAFQFVAPLATRLTIGVAYLLHRRRQADESPAHRAISSAAWAFRSREANAIFVSSLEFVGGLCLVVGLGTRIFAALLSFSMIVALLTSDGGDWIAKFPADITDVTSFTYLLFLIWLVVYGPGPISLDKLISKWLKIDQPGAGSTSAK